MAVFSGNPADRVIGGIPGSIREAQRPSGMSNGTQRDAFGSGGLGVSNRDGGFAGAARSAPTGVGSGGGIRSSSGMSPGFRSGAVDSASIQPGRVVMKPETVSFGKQYPALSGFLGYSTTNPKIVTQDQVNSLMSTVQKTGAYISGASPLASSQLSAEAKKNIGTIKPNYAQTTIGMKTLLGTPTITLSYPKSVPTGRSFGTYQSGIPTQRSTQPTSAYSSASKMSTGPVSRGIQAPRASLTGNAPSVSSARTVSREAKAAVVYAKNGYNYVKQGDRYQNFTASGLMKDFRRK